MAKRSNVKSVGEILKNVFSEWKIDDKLIHQRIIMHWQEIMGKPVAENTEKIFFQGRRKGENILCIRMKSSVWRNEISMQRTKVRERVNEFLKTEFITEVKVS